MSLSLRMHNETGCLPSDAAIYEIHRERLVIEKTKASQPWAYLDQVDCVALHQSLMVRRGIPSALAAATTPTFRAKDTACWRNAGV